MANQQRKEPMPTFDFTKVGRKFMKEWADLVNEATRYGKILSGLMPEGNSREALEEFETLYQEYQAKIEACGEAQVEMICQILKNVPKAWLVSSAPADIDWSDSASIDYIQADRWTQLMQIVGEGQAFRQSAKN